MDLDEIRYWIMAGLELAPLLVAIAAALGITAALLLGRKESDMDDQ